MPATRWTTIALVLVVSTAVFSLYYGPLMWTPNEAAPTFGGDGLTVHYNLQYHATYGEGVDLTSQYYPYHENIFLTDGQAVVAIVLSALRPIVPTIGDYAVGVSNALIFWSNVLSVLLLFLVLRRLGLPAWLALMVGLLTALMSPQILRQLGGQYTLGFTFLLPLTILYQLSYSGRRSYLIWSAGMMVVITLLGLNNPYLYAITASYLLAGSVIGWIMGLLGRSGNDRTVLIHWVVVCVVTTATVFLTIRYFDRAPDRTEVPFGFFHNVATWGGLLSNQDVFAYKTIRSVFSRMAEPRRENQLYLGLVPMLIAVGSVVVVIVRRRLPRYDRSLGLMLLAAVAGLVFAFGLPFLYFPDWTYDNLGVVLQFRAPVRFAWPLYYVFSIAAGYCLWYFNREAKNKMLATVVVAAALLAWTIEAHQWSRGAVKDHIYHNAFHPSRMADFRELTDSLSLNSANYSSIYVLPSEQGWSDMVHRDGAWRSNHDGYKMALAAGLPLLNGKLSKVPLSVTLASLQLISDRLVEPVLLAALDDRSILLLVSRENDLLPGEQLLVDLATPVYRNDHLSLFRVSADTLRRAYKQEVQSVRNRATNDTTEFVRIPMEANVDHAFTGRGSRRIEPKWQSIVDFPLPDAMAGDSLELSMWYYLNRERYGGPTVYLRFMDADGERISEQALWSNSAVDTQHGWLRLPFRFRPPTGTVTLDLVSNYFYHYYLDELQLRRVDDATLVELDSGEQLLNNFRVTPKARSVH